uniref:Uncharacterized protein n=1 Tax=Vespula pensylvanica TaxID=30213 RepID=A0A834P9W8_VESPE|nr:hypothetical protein H0235_002466 [Vespula pensylvanica]
MDRLERARRSEENYRESRTSGPPRQTATERKIVQRSFKLSTTCKDCLGSDPFRANESTGRCSSTKVSKRQPDMQSRSSALKRFERKTYFEEFELRFELKSLRSSRSDHPSL